MANTRAQRAFANVSFYCGQASSSFHAAKTQLGDRCIRQICCMSDTLQIGISVGTRRRSHRTPEAAGHVSLVGEARSSCNVTQRVSQSNQAGGKANARLALITVRRHTGRSFKDAKQLEWRKTGSFGDVGQSHVLIEMVIKEVARESDGPRLSTGRSRWQSTIRMPLKKPRDECDIPFVAPQRRSGSFRIRMDLTQKQRQLRIADDRACQRRNARRATIALSEQVLEARHLDIERSQAPAVRVNRPTGMSFVSINRIEVARASYGLGSTCPNTDRAARDNGKAGLVVRVDI